MTKTIDVETMTVEEKLQTMEALWENLCRQAEGIPIPAWHAELLAEREARVKSGEETFEDWDVVKKKIRARHS